VTWDTDVVAVRCGATFRARRSFYHALAHALALAPRPADAIFETTATEVAPWALVRPARVAHDLARTRSGEYGPLEVRPVPGPLYPAGRCVDRIGFVVPTPVQAGWSPDPVPLVAPSIGSLLGPGGWLGLQTLWVKVPSGSLGVLRRFRYAAPDRAELLDRFDSVGAALAYDWMVVTGRPAMGRRAGPGGHHGWNLRVSTGVPEVAWAILSPDAASATAEVRWFGLDPGPRPPSGHAVVFGASGAGKTTYLAHRAAEAIADGRPVVAIDLHGDLVPGVMRRLDPSARERVVAIDAGERPVPGIAALTGRDGDDRAAGLFVASVKRLTADGTDVYWGFRLERIFDTFVRLVQETGGSLLDLFDLLTSPDRRDAARLASRRPELVRFLEELEPVVRRNPDFLWSAATRLSKIALVPGLSELLAPPDGGIPVEELLAAGRTLLIRIPVARLGPEAAGLAGTLVLARVFLGLAGRDGAATAERPVLLVLDEVQGFSPRLVAEVLTESRKFGVRAVVATQYPDRLAPEVRAAAAGASTHFVAFRVPPATATEAGAWLGLEAAAAQQLLPALPPGRGIELEPESGSLRSVAGSPDDGSGEERGWSAAVERTRSDFAPSATNESAPAGDDAATERLLLALLAAEEERRALRVPDLLASAAHLPGPPVDGATLADRWGTAVHQGWAEIRDGYCVLTGAGARWLGLSAPTLARRETPEHRRLLLRAFRIFARRGYRLEIVRQGRFDTTLPDAIFRQLPVRAGANSPNEIAGAVDRLRTGWAWRFFGGRDVFVEAEVSGASRAERIRHGVAKAAARDAYVLFLVSDAPRARRVRTVLARERVGRGRAQVWTLPVPGEPKS
jgi:hypothetical protein